MKNGRSQKVTADEIWEYLSDEDWHKVGELAKNYKVCNATIRNKISILQEAGFCLLPGRDGWKLVDETSFDDETCKAYFRVQKWISGLLMKLAKTAEPMMKRQIVAAIRKALPSTKGDRKVLREFSVLMRRVIDAADIEDDDLT